MKLSGFYATPRFNISLFTALLTVISCAATMSEATPTKPNNQLPLKIGVVLFPGFQNQDVFGPLDVFLGASMFVPGNMSLYLLASSLEPVTTRHMAMAMPSHFGFEITPTHTFDNPPSDIDVLLVPGGMGTRDTTGILDPARNFVIEMYPKLKYLLTVCTGSALIGPTGLLDGKRATTNKASWAWATSQGPKVRWVKQARWVVDGKIWTSSGVMAGIDMSFAWIHEVYNGKAKNMTSGEIIKDLGKTVADRVEYERHTDPRWDPFAKIWGLV